MLRRLSLRARLILGVIALSALGLVTADVITYTSLHRFLISRTDDFLDTAHVSAESGLHGPGRGPPHGGQQGPDAAGRPDIGRLEARVRDDRRNGRCAAVLRHDAVAAATSAEDDRVDLAPRRRPGQLFQRSRDEGGRAVSRQGVERPR